MKQQVFFIHGGEAYSNYEDFLFDLENEDLGNPLGEMPKRWSRTLRSDLLECEVYTPSMPNKQNAHYEEWKIWFERHFLYLKDDVTLIGHSQGGMFLVKYLLENITPFKIRALFLIAAVHVSDSKINESREDGGDFVFDTSKVSQLQNKAQNIVIMHSTDDFVVPYDHALRYKAALPDAELVTFEDKNHFLVEEFPELLERVRWFGK